MAWIDEIKGNLGKYKEKRYPALSDGEYNHKGKTHYLSHIFPRICSCLNLLETYRDDFLKSNFAKITFHKYFHHLNSSQAMCINFFYPLIQEKKLEIILENIELSGEEANYDSIEFEKESCIDKRNGEKPTNFDFFFKTKLGKELYFEIKYTENKFGTAIKNTAHNDKYNNIYKNAAKNTINPDYNNCDSFLTNYQIMRNLIHISDNSYVVFIIPKNNKYVKNQADKAKDFVVRKHKDKVKVLYWDCLYELFDHEKYEGNLKAQFEEFKDKYHL